MADYPAMPLFSDAFVADTIHLGAAETGAYLLLLMAAWRRPNCDLPDDDKFLARNARVTPDEWAAMKDEVMAFWNYDGRSKTWHQKRQRKERDRAEMLSRLNRDKAAKRWKRTKKNDAGAMPRDMPKPCRDDAPIPIESTTPLELETDVSTSRESPTLPTPTTDFEPNGSQSSVSPLPQLPLDEPAGAAAPSDEKPSKAVARRLPDDWRLSRTLGEWALAQEIDGKRLTEAEVRVQAAMFADYWHSKAGAAARRTDWDAVWRNWVRKAISDKRAPTTGEVKPFGFETREQAQNRREIDLLTRRAMALANGGERRHG